MSYQNRRGRGRGPPETGRGSDVKERSGQGSGKSSDYGRGRGRDGRIPASIYAPPGRTAQIDARLRDTSQNEFVTRFKSVKITQADPPLRPGYGEVGKPVALRTNFFPVSIPKGPFYEYEVTITPPIKIKRVRRRIFELAEDTSVWKVSLAGFVAHDHSAKLVARKRLPQHLSVDVPFYEEDEDPPAPGTQADKEYRLSIGFVQELETESIQRYISGDPQYLTYDIMPIISAFNLILAAYPTRSGGGGVMVGRNKFFMPGTGPSMSLGGGLEAVRGFYSSVRTTHQQLMVNVNVCTTTFYKPGNLARAMSEFMDMGSNARASTFVKGLRIKAIHLGYRKTVKQIHKDTAESYTFDSGEYGKLSVKEYFHKKYKIQLKFPNLPLVDVGGQRVNLLPPELCEILPNQPYRGKLLDSHTATMITYAAQPPNANAQAIESQGLQELGFTQSASTLDAFGVEIGKEMAVVPGRVLPPPKVKYSKDADAAGFRADKASWNLRQVQFTKGGILENWAVLLLRDGNPEEFNGMTDPKLREILADFVDMCKTSGMVVKSSPVVAEAHLPPRDRADPTRTAAITKIREAFQSSFKQKPKMIMVILSNSDSHVYSGLKRLCDVGLDVATVCVQTGKFRGGGPQFYANVAMKFNIKLGGINHTLDKTSLSWLKEKPTMLVGVDVTHPGAGAVKGTPSIAAVVGNIDDNFAQFPASMRMQKSKKEMVTALETMMTERLNAYNAKNKKYPERVLIYRDGVSEGQFPTVLEEEMPAVTAAFQKIRPGYRPKLTIVICGKRHHTRFFPTDARHADEKFNSLPGTVVDRGVTSVYLFDFYLQAHGSLQGTSRATHYHVIHDEMNFTADKLQTLTNNICYMFVRATKAVSLASPAYYADLACERGRCYLQELLQGYQSGNVSATSADEDEVKKEASKHWRNGPTGNNIRNMMFYI